MFLKAYFGAFTTHEALAFLKVLGTLTKLIGNLGVAFPYFLCEDAFIHTMKPSRSLCTVAEILVMLLMPCFAIQLRRTSKYWSQSFHDPKSKSFLKSISSTSSCVMRKISIIYTKKVKLCTSVPEYQGTISAAVVFRTRKLINQTKLSSDSSGPSLTPEPCIG